MMKPIVSTHRPRNRIAAAGWTLVGLVAAIGLADWILDGFGARLQGPEIIGIYAIGLLALVLSSTGLLRCGVRRHRLPQRPGALRPLGLAPRDWVFALVFSMMAAPGFWVLRNLASAEALLASCR